MSSLAIASNISSIGELQFIIENEIEKFLNNLPAIDPISSAISYVLKSGGKRIRPVFALALMRDLDEPAESYASISLALELLHISSLVHDDLPALDNDEERRGQKTCHIKFNEATAVLTGDILIPMALQLVTRSNASPSSISKVIEILCEAYRDLCYGQQMDLNSAKSKSEHLSIAKLKTGALFSAAVSIPFELISVNEANTLIAKEVGINIGVLYQICDDIADRLDSARLKGRTKSSDEKNNKNNFYSDDTEETNNLIQSVQYKIETLLKILESKCSVKKGFANFREALNSLFATFETLNIQF